MWNGTIAPTFGIRSISFWQAVGLFVPAKLFFGFGFNGSNRRIRSRRGRRRHRSRGDDAAPAYAPADDESFRMYWQEEGREAYQAFLDARGRDGDQ